MLVEELTRETQTRFANGTSELSAAPKTILMHVHNDNGLQDRVDLALWLAKTYGAHLQFLHVIPNGAYLVTDGTGNLVCEIARVLEQEAVKLRSKIEAQLAKASVSWEYEDITDDVTQALRQRAGLTDLIVVGREPRSREFDDTALTTIGSLLEHARVPILVVGSQVKPLDLPARGMIAWNGSVEAANALRAATGLLQSISEVHIVCVGEIDENLFDASLALAYLAHFGIRATRVDRPQSFNDVAEELVDYAITQDIGFIVMGGYSHNRAREFMFGGVTRDLLSDCPISLILSK